jgi:hypothetical protein
VAINKSGELAIYSSGSSGPYGIPYLLSILDNSLKNRLTRLVNFFDNDYSSGYLYSTSDEGYISIRQDYSSGVATIQKIDKDLNLSYSVDADLSAWSVATWYSSPQFVESNGEYRFLMNDYNGNLLTVVVDASGVTLESTQIASYYYLYITSIVKANSGYFAISPWGTLFLLDNNLTYQSAVDISNGYDFFSNYATPPQYKLYSNGSLFNFGAIVYDEPVSAPNHSKLMLGKIDPATKLVTTKTFDFNVKILDHLSCYTPSGGLATLLLIQTSATNTDVMFFKTDADLNQLSN